MSNAPTTIDPIAFDTELAELVGKRNRMETRLVSMEGHFQLAAGARFYYKGRNRVTDMSFEEAYDIVRNALDEGKYLFNSCTIRPYDDGPNMVEHYQAQLAEYSELIQVITAKEQGYTGWSRFFLVTSSQGHVHSSMHCSTCRPTTTYGWLPNLSGKTEADAVAECGEVLCSVCFPSAPVAWTSSKLSKAQANKKAAQ